MVKYIKLDKEDNNIDTNNSLFYIRYIYFKLIYYRSKYNFNKIIINLRIAMHLMELSSFNKINVNNNTFTRTLDPYPIGKLGNIKFYVDPNLKWNCNDIFVNYNKTDIRKNKINKLINKKSIKMLDKIIIDQNISDKLF